MRNPRLTRWKNLKQMEGLLLVAQHLQECLSDYTLDSYKTPALNTHTRCLELLSTVQDVERGFLTPRNQRPLVEEVVVSIAKDHAAKTLLGPHAKKFVTASWWQVDDPKRLRVQAQLLRDFLAGGKYESQLVTQLTALVQDPKQKDRIIETTINLAVEWMHLKFSRDYIYTRAKSFFFGLGGPQLSSPSQIADFLSLLKPKERSFDVCFRVSASWAALLPEPLADFIEITNGPPPARAGFPREKDFLAKSHTGVYAIVKGIKALDARSARNDAFNRLAVLASFGACYMHRSPLSWDGEAVAWEEKHPLVLKQSLPPIHKENDCPSDKLSEKFGDMIRALNPARLPSSSYIRLTAAFGLHSSALRTEDVSVQLSTLWAALEALLPAGIDDSKIGSVSEALLPVLSHGYPAKLLMDLSVSLNNCCGATYAATLGAVSGGQSELSRLAAIISVKDNAPLRDKLYCALERNPLLRHRVFFLKRALESPGNILEFIGEHSRRVSWHLSRIYRNRNLLLHAGRSLPYRDSLVENLHSYFHDLVRALQERFSSPSPPHNIDSALLRVKMDHLAHLEYLASAKKEAVTQKNYNELIFGPQM